MARIFHTMQNPTASPATFPRVKEREDSDSMKWSRYGKDVLPMWVADMDFEAAEPILQALRQRLNHGVFGYSLPSAKLRRTCVEYFERRWNYKIEPEWIVFTPGLGVALHTITRYVGDQDKGVLMPEPIYPVFRRACPRARRAAINVPMRNEGDEWQLSIDDLKLAAKRGHGADVLMLCNPHNPNGKVFTKDELVKIAEFALSEKMTICSDEVHADLILDEDRKHVPIASLSPEVESITITLQSPSKAFNIPGLNFAVGIIANPKLRELYKFGSSGQVVDQLNPFGMAGAVAAWSEECDRWLSDCISLLRENRNKLQESLLGLQGITMSHLQATYLAWLKVDGLKLEDPHKHFVSHGIALSDGADFGDPRYLRLNFGCGPRIMDEGISRVAQAVEAAGK